jgi:hypothetical protein
MNSSSKSAKSVSELQWKWIFIGLFFGLISTVIANDITSSSYPGTIIPAIVGSISGFLIMGIVVGWLSPGVTIKEAVVAGIIMIFVLFIYLGFSGQLSVIPISYIIIALVIGFLFSLLGGWIGEILQGETEDKKSPGLQWRWIVVGVIIGFSISALLLLILAPKSSERTIIYLLCIGFITTGILVGKRSPGVTLIEAAIGGAITAILDYILFVFLLSQNIPVYVFFGVGTSLSFGTIIIVFIIGLVLSLIGGFIGEAIQSRYEKK